MSLREERIMLSKQQNGFTLIELMVSMVIGLFLLAGVFTIYLSSSETSRVVENEVKMMGDARFAIETIAYDLRHAGGYGHHNHEAQSKVFDEELFESVTGQCGGGGSKWVVDLNRPVYGVDDGTDYLTSCMDNWAQGDSLEVRYASAMPAGTLETDLAANMIYLKSIPGLAHMFVGDTPPDTLPFQKSDGSDKPNIRYYIWKSRGYYIADYTDKVGDGMPSLRLVALEPGPVVTDSVLLRGVEEFQIQFGLDTPLAGKQQGDESVNSYVNAANVGSRWNHVIAARIWLVLRSEDTVEEVDPTSVYTVAGVNKVNGDKYKRTVVSTSIRLRNVNTGE